MKIITVKGPGAGGFIVGEEKNRLPWLEYRKFKMDKNFIKNIIEGLKWASLDNKIVYIPGGTGAYLFIGLASEIGLSDFFQSIVGCEVVDLMGKIFIEGLKKENVNVCPNLIRYYEINEYVTKYDVLIIKSDDSLDSTDSLATKSALEVNSEIMFFKKNVPEFYVGYKEPRVVEEFMCEDLINKAKRFGERPGNNSIIDLQAINMISKNKTKATLYNSDDIKELRNIINNTLNVKKTIIT